MKKVTGKTILVTGAAAGIGYCLAENLAKAGAVLVLTDINAKALEEAKDKLADHGAVIYTRALDVSDKKAVFTLAKWVEESLGGLDILVNNAGIGHSGELAETTLEDWHRLININFFGPLYHVYAFLPYMKEKNAGHIVNVSSGQAFFRLPTWGAYATVKLALGAFSELLYFELKKYKIKVTTVYPFMVNTGFYDNIEAETWGAKMSMKLLPYYSMTPQKVAKIIFKAIRKETQVEMVSIFNDVGYYSRLVPPVSNVISSFTNILLAGGKKEK